MDWISLNMPTNPTLPTLAQVIEEVKKQDWVADQKSKITCTECESFHYRWCPVEIARAQQAAVAKALRWACELRKDIPMGTRLFIEETADAIEKELEDGTK